MTLSSLIFTLNENNEDMDFCLENDCSFGFTWSGDENISLKKEGLDRFNEILSLEIAFDGNGVATIPTKTDSQKELAWEFFCARYNTNSDGSDSDEDIFGKYFFREEEAE